MALVTGNSDLQNLAAGLLASVLFHPQDVMRKAGEIERLALRQDKREVEEKKIEGKLDAKNEEWEVLTAVAASLRDSSPRWNAHPPAAEIHLLRHLAARRQVL